MEFCLKSHSSEINHALQLNRDFAFAANEHRPSADATTADATVDSLRCHFSLDAIEYGSSYCALAEHRNRCDARRR